MEMEGKSMAEKMDNKKKPAPTTLPVPVPVEQKQQQQARAAPPFLHIDVPLFNLWTLFNAVIVVTISFGFAVVAYRFIPHYASRASSWLLMLPRAVTKLTDTEDSLASALVIGMQWCSKIQVAAGALMVLVLLLPCHRGSVRRAAAYAALALTVAGHCMYAATVLVLLRAATVLVLLRADPGGLVLLRANPPGGLFFLLLGNAAIFICAVGDILRILAILRRREDD